MGRCCGRAYVSIMQQLLGQPVRKTALIAIALVIVIGAGAFLVGPPPAKGSETSAEALAASEAATELVEDPQHSRPFEVSIWEPTTELDRHELVVISHGFSGDRTSHANLAQGLAAEGYTFAAPPTQTSLVWKAATRISARSFSGQGISHSRSTRWSQPTANPSGR